MFKFWKGRKEKSTSLPTQDATIEAFKEEGEAIIQLQGKNIQRFVVPVVGLTVLELAEKNEVDWKSFCKRGICARCRCHVSEGMDFLSEPNEAEEARLDPEEIEEGYRLGCQARLVRVGAVTIKHSPYF